MCARQSPGLFLALAVAATLLLLALHCEAQVNFSPSWGKRTPGGGVSGPAMVGDATPCRASAESLLYIYKLIQNEAQKLLNCEKFSE